MHLTIFKDSNLPVIGKTGQLRQGYFQQSLELFGAARYIYRTMRIFLTEPRQLDAAKYSIS